MPPRPSYRSKENSRPLSAIYIGNQFNGNNSNNNNHASSGAITTTVSNPSPIPDLPEPPSPVSSTGSGLPSPPATNSTGSGSTGDPDSIAARRQPVAMLNIQKPQLGSMETSTTMPVSSRSSSRLSWRESDHDIDDNEQDEEQTARVKVGASSELALQRARSLVQRNKIQLDKLSSSRLGTASPTPSSSSRANRHSMPDPGLLSGSETEREGDGYALNSASSASSRSKASSNSTFGRTRLSSAPDSPRRARLQLGSGNDNNNSPSRRRKRVSLASTSECSNHENSDDDDDYDRRTNKTGERFEIGTARDRMNERQEISRDDRSSTRGVISLNSAKKSPLSSVRRRSALPREFREGSTDELQNVEGSPNTPYRSPSTSNPSSASLAANSTNTLGRRSTLRGMRGASEDYRNSPYSPRESLVHDSNRSTMRAGTATASPSTSRMPHTPSETSSTLTRAGTVGRQMTASLRERRQTLRGGSAESALGGRSLVSEGLKAAGLSLRTGAETLAKQKERTGSTPVSATRSTADMREARAPTTISEAISDRASVVSGETTSRRSAGDRSIFSEGRRVEWSPVEVETKERTFDDLRRRSIPPRASTSMADYSHTSRHRDEIESDDELEDEEGMDEMREGRKHKNHKKNYPLLSSREASLARREQSLLERERDIGKREKELERAGSMWSRYQGGTPPVTPAPTPTPFSGRDRYPPGTKKNFGAGQATSSQQQPQPSQVQTEHARLMVESLSMFDSQVSKLSPSFNSSANHAEMVVRNAQTLVLSAERLNMMLRSGTTKALEAQIDAEVDGDYSGSRDGTESLADLWRKVGGEYREGLRVSDDLIRAVTGLLLGVGRVMKEALTPGGSTPSESGSRYGGSPLVHARSISLGEEDVRRRSSPDHGVGGLGSSGSGSGGKESRRSWEPSKESLIGGPGSTLASNAGASSREEALRRLAGVRSDSPLARASPAFLAARELDRLETASPAIGGALSLPRVNIPGTRRLFTPREQREMALNASMDGQDAGYEPSPTPLSRTRVFDLTELGEFAPQQVAIQDVASERSRTVPSLSAPSATSSEQPLRRNVTISGGPGTESDKMSSSRHERRKISIASIATIRASMTNAASHSNSSTTSSVGPPGFSVLTTPSSTTTAVTLDGALGMARTESGTEGAAAKPTFSRPEGISSVSGLQQHLEEYKKRTEVEGVNERDAEADIITDVRKGRNETESSLITPESDRGLKRKTLGRLNARASLENAGPGVRSAFEGPGGRGTVNLSVNAADRSAAATLGAGRKERRRTVTDIWPRS